VDGVNHLASSRIPQQAAAAAVRADASITLMQQLLVALQTTTLCQRQMNNRTPTHQMH